MVLTLAVVLGFGATALAGPGRGYARGGFGPGMHGYGPHMMGPGYGPGAGRGFGGYCYTGNLSAEEIKVLDEKRTAFWEATKGLRNDLYEKRLELDAELAKQNPDVSKIGKLQKEISALRTELDQKRVEHVVEMKKINPEIGRGLAGNGFRGYRPGYGGGCWR